MHLYYTVVQLIKQVNYQNRFTVRWRFQKLYIHRFRYKRSGIVNRWIYNLTNAPKIGAGGRG